MAITGTAEPQPRTADAKPGLGKPAEVAGYLEIPEHTLAQWRRRGIGPQFRRVGRHVRYRWSDVDLWIDAQPGGGDNAA